MISCQIKKWETIWAPGFCDWWAVPQPHSLDLPTSSECCWLPPDTVDSLPGRLPPTAKLSSFLRAEGFA